MLDPQDRLLLSDSLRPPQGYSLDYAIVTTYSLDLVSLMAAPIALARFDWEGAEDGGNPDPLMVLESLRRCSDRLAVFCEPGRIAVPRDHHLLFAMLEPIVHEVRAPKPGKAFHPKVWVVRYSARREPTRYRVLVLSRNLTSDRCWDVIVRLDGELLDRQNAIAANHPLADFVAALPRLCLRSASPDLLKAVDRLQRELRKVRFDPPEGFTDVAFWPLGVAEYASWPFESVEGRLLVISPFIEPGCLKRLTHVGKGHILVSRLEELDVVSRESLKSFKSVFTLPLDADREVQDEEVESAGDGLLRGLHAKVYVADAGNHARIWLGSANATNAAFNGNVEFLVELTSGRSHAGVGAVLQRTQDRTGLLDLLEEYNVAGDVTRVDAELERLEERLEQARRTLADARMVASVRIDGDAFGLTLRIPVALRLPSGVTARCWPITQREDVSAQTVSTSRTTIAHFRRVAFEGLTSFFAFHVIAKEGKRSAGTRFVLNLPLEGAPVDRQRTLLRAMLRDRAEVTRLLLLLLADEADWDAVNAAIMRSGDGSDSGQVSRGREVPLLEGLLRVLHRSPTKLDSIAELITQLGSDGEAHNLLPANFEQVWGPIWAARQVSRA
jgi:hypothetical protein